MGEFCGKGPFLIQNHQTGRPVLTNGRHPFIEEINWVGWILKTYTLCYCISIPTLQKVIRNDQSEYMLHHCHGLYSRQPSNKIPDSVPFPPVSLKGRGERAWVCGWSTITFNQWPHLQEFSQSLYKKKFNLICYKWNKLTLKFHFDCCHIKLHSYI